MCLVLAGGSCFGASFASSPEQDLFSLTPAIPMCPSLFLDPVLTFPLEDHQCRSHPPHYSQYPPCCCLEYLHHREWFRMERERSNTKIQFSCNIYRNQQILAVDLAPLCPLRLPLRQFPFLHQTQDSFSSASWDGSIIYMKYV